MKAAILILLALAGSPQHLYGLHQVPSVRDVASAISTTSRYCGAICPRDDDEVQVRRLRCEAESAQSVRKRGDSLLQGGARCTFQYRIAKPGERVRWQSAREHFDYTMWGCGDEGQEADLWCFSWRTRYAELENQEDT